MHGVHAWREEKGHVTIPHLAKATLQGLALSGDGPDLLLQDLSMCSGLAQLHIVQRCGPSREERLLALLPYLLGGGRVSSKGLQALVTGPCKGSLRDTGAAYKLGDISVLLDAGSSSGLAGRLERLVLPVTSCVPQQKVRGRA
jgi:hypothetical protein